MKEKEEVEILAEIEKLWDEIFTEHYTRFQWLSKYGPNAFEADGTLVTNTEGKQKTNHGREFILRTLAFFEIQDDSFCYKTCAKLKKVLDHYDARFKTTKEQKIQSQERFQEFRSVDRERKGVIEKVRLDFLKK